MATTHSPLQKLLLATGSKAHLSDDEDFQAPQSINDRYCRTNNYFAEKRILRSNDKSGRDSEEKMTGALPQKVGLALDGYLSQFRARSIQLAPAHTNDVYYYSRKYNALLACAKREANNNLEVIQREISAIWESASENLKVELTKLKEIIFDFQMCNQQALRTGICKVIVHELAQIQQAINRILTTETQSLCSLNNLPISLDLDQKLEDGYQERCQNEGNKRLLKKCKLILLLIRYTISQVGHYLQYNKLAEKTRNITEKSLEEYATSNLMNDGSQSDRQIRALKSDIALLYKRLLKQTKSEAKGLRSIFWQDIRSHLEDFMFEDEDDFTAKWREYFKKYLNLKAKTWRKNQSNLFDRTQEVAVCQTCNKIFKAEALSGHAGLCLEHSQATENFSKNREQILKLLENASALKQDLSLKASIQKKFLQNSEPITRKSNIFPLSQQELTTATIFEAMGNMSPKAISSMQHLKVSSSRTKDDMHFFDRSPGSIDMSFDSIKGEDSPIPRPSIYKASGFKDYQEGKTEKGSLFSLEETKSIVFSPNKEELISTTSQGNVSENLSPLESKKGDKTSATERTLSGELEPPKVEGTSTTAATTTTITVTTAIEGNSTAENEPATDPKKKLIALRNQKTRKNFFAKKSKTMGEDALADIDSLIANKGNTITTESGLNSQEENKQQTKELDAPSTDCCEKKNLIEKNENKNLNTEKTITNYENSESKVEKDEDRKSENSKILQTISESVETENKSIDNTQGRTPENLGLLSSKQEISIAEKTSKSEGILTDELDSPKIETSATTTTTAATTTANTPDEGNSAVENNESAADSKKKLISLRNQKSRKNFFAKKSKTATEDELPDFGSLNPSHKETPATTMLDPISQEEPKQLTPTLQVSFSDIPEKKFLTGRESLSTEKSTLCSQTTVEKSEYGETLRAFSLSLEPKNKDTDNNTTNLIFEGLNEEVEKKIKEELKTSKNQIEILRQIISFAEAERNNRVVALESKELIELCNTIPENSAIFHVVREFKDLLEERRKIEDNLKKLEQSMRSDRTADFRAGGTADPSETALLGTNTPKLSPLMKPSDFANSPQLLFSCNETSLEHLDIGATKSVSMPELSLFEAIKHPQVIEENKNKLPLIHLQNIQESKGESVQTGKKSPDDPSPSLIKRSPKFSGLGLSKSNQSFSEVEEKAKSPSHGSNNESSENSKDNSDENSKGLVGVSFKDIMLSKKRVTLRSPDASPKRNLSTSKSPQKEKEKDVVAQPAVPKIKEIRARKTAFEQALEQSQGCLITELSTIRDKFTGARSDLPNKQILNSPAKEIATMIPEISDLIAKKESDNAASLKVGGVVMKTFARRNSDVAAKSSLVNCFEKSPSPRRSSCTFNGFDELTLLRLNQNHIGGINRRDSGIGSPELLISDPTQKAEIAQKKCLKGANGTLNAIREKLKLTELPILNPNSPHLIKMRKNTL